jgi:ABC-type sugar transport system ATPase subunit
MLGDWAGKEVVLGARPEAMNLSSEGRFGGEENILPVKVSVIEPLGEKMDLYAATEKHPHIVARVDARRDLDPGADVQLHLDMRKIHVFEPGEVGANLTARSPAEAMA